MNSSEIKDRLRRICRRYHVEIMYAFGSRAGEIKGYIAGKRKKRATVSSDADIGIKTCRGTCLTVREKAQMMIELEDLLEVGRVDLVVLGEADPFVAANVIRGDRLFCEDDYLADEYELYVLRRAGDLAPLERERLNLIFEVSS
ncbi:MAG: hypothetical protein JRJ26_13940 [Deltaproteobacteria bacterium]|nr:hypothetical protein [Deltaproteobacteria bacterium]